MDVRVYLEDTKDRVTAGYDPATTDGFSTDHDAFYSVQIVNHDLYLKQPDKILYEHSEFGSEYQPPASHHKNTWQDLYYAINGAPTGREYTILMEGNATAQRIYNFYGNFDYEDYDYRWQDEPNQYDREYKNQNFIIKKGQDIVLDLNGHTLDRNGQSLFDGDDIASGTVMFKVKSGGKLTIIDTSIEKTGRITGAGSSNYGAFDAFQVESGGTLILENCTIRGNISNEVIYNSGTLEMNGAVIENNNNCTNGIIKNNGSGNATLTNVTIQNNTNKGAYGGINNNGTLTLNRCKFLNNKNSNSNGMGAALYNDASGKTVTLDRCVISGNTARDGAGIFNNVGTMELIDVDMENNAATGWGGAILNKATLNLTVSNDNADNMIANNTAGSGGGIFAKSGTVTVNKAIITGNRADKTAITTGTNNGGGLYQAGGTVTLSDCYVQNNYALHDGGGIDVAGGNPIRLENSNTITGNEAGSRGGGVFLYRNMRLATGPYGVVQIMDNNRTGAAGGDDVYFQSTGYKVVLEGKLREDTKIGIYPIAGSMTVTSGFSTNNTWETSSGAFFSNAVINSDGTARSFGPPELKNGEVYFTLENNVPVYNIGTSYDSGMGDVYASKEFVLANASDKLVKVYAVPRDGYSLVSGYPRVLPEDASLGDIDLRNLDEEYVFEFTMPDGNVTIEAQFVPIEYTITPDEGIPGGTVSADKETAYVGDEITLTAQTAAHYEFDSFSVKDADGNDVPVDDGKFTMPASNVTVSANFKETVYTLTFDANGGTGAVPSDLHATINRACKLPESILTGPDGTTFDGWKIGETLYFARDAVTLSADATAVAQWSDGDWESLQNMLSFRPDGAVIKLDRDYTAAADDAALLIPEGKTLTLDLNGHTIDRGLADGEAVANGNVITNNGTLTITDSSPDGSGAITGGNSTGAGGGIHNYGWITIEGGSITGNRADLGGGIWTSKGITINGGAISGNTAAEEGGGVFYTGGSSYPLEINGGRIENNTAGTYGGGISSGYTMLNGGIISGNTATNGGGIYNAGNLNVTGGTVSGNTAAENGGGICNDSSSGVDLYLGSATVTANTAKKGGGIYTNGSQIELNDAPHVTGNKNSSGADNNLFIADKTQLVIDASFNSDARIGVSISLSGAASQVITSRLPQSGVGAEAFSSDNTKRTIVLSDSGEAVFVRIYKIGTNISGKGKLTVDKRTALAGETVTVTATPREGYRIDVLRVNMEDLTGNTFIVPDFILDDIIVNAVFVIKTYTVTWYNEDGTLLETDENAEHFSAPSYDGAAPEKEGMQFVGWNDGTATYAADALPAVTGDVVYTAVFSESEHILGAPAWTWAADHSSATATFTCSCGDQIELTDNAPVLTEISAAGCLSNRVVKYTATVESEGVAFTDTTAEITLANTATGHSFTNYVYDGNATCAENGTETALCSNGCGETDTREAADTATGHSFTNYVYNQNATCTENGTETALCNNGCGETDTREAADTATGHSFTKYVYDGNATCTSDGTLTAACDNGCGETDTREAANTAKGHSFTTYVYNNDATCTADGTETATCNNYGCGETDTREAVNTATGHRFTNYVYNGDATCTENGTETAACDNGCGETDTREAANTATGHTYGEPVWTWSEDHSSVTATFTCEKGDDIKTVTQNTTEVEVSAATATADQVVKYTVSVTVNGKTYTTESENVTVPGTATGTPDTPTDPTQPENPTDPDTPSGSNLCKWDNVDHGTSFWGRIVKFFHSILYFFAHLFGRR